MATVNGPGLVSEVIPYLNNVSLLVMWICAKTQVTAIYSYYPFNIRVPHRPWWFLRFVVAELSGGQPSGLLNAL